MNMEKSGVISIIILIIVAVVVVGGAVTYIVVSGDDSGSPAEITGTDGLIRDTIIPIINNLDETMILTTEDFESEIVSVGEIGGEWKVSVDVGGDSGDLEDTLYFFYDSSSEKFVRVDSKNGEIISQEVTLAEFEELLASIKAMAEMFG